MANYFVMLFLIRHIVNKVDKERDELESTTYTLPSGDHLISLRNRKRLDMTNVKSIERFDQEEFLLLTSQGNLLVRGEQLRIVHLDVDKGLLTLEGEVKLLQYDESEALSKSILHKLFG